jgi:hypothetical protein
MLSPDGQVGDVPLEQVPNAVKGGYKLGQDMLSPDGKSGTIPLDSVHDALGKGFQLKGSAPKLPQPDMQTAGVVVPDAGRMPAFTPGTAVSQPGNKVTDKQAAGGLAAGALVGATPFAVSGAAALGSEYAPEIAKAVVKHIAEPGTVLKFPYGRAVEYYMMGKLGLSKGAVGKIASHIPIE